MLENVESKLVKLETLYENLAKQVEEIKELLAIAQQMSDKLRLAVHEREVVNGFVKSELEGITKELELIKREQENLKRFYWGAIGGIAVFEFLVKFVFMK